MHQTWSERGSYVVDEATGCWLWTGAVNKAGYAYGYLHRKSWEAVNGPRPEGYDIHHLCKQPACLNPDHLQALSPREHDRLHFIHEKMGLTEQDILDIRELGKRHVNIWEVCAQYGISHFPVYNIWAGTRWTDILGESGPVERTPPMCAREGCDKPAALKRTARFCSPACRSVQGTRDYRRRAKAA